jgi:hypothetical protein
MARVHPDQGGDESLFIWATALREHVEGSEAHSPIGQRPNESQAREYDDSIERVDFGLAFSRYGSFGELTMAAVTMARDVSPVYGRLLRLLRDCYPGSSENPIMRRQENQGATYKSLAAVAYKAGMSKEERIGWYRVAESVPLAQRHVGHIISRLQEEAA